MNFLNNVLPPHNNGTINVKVIYLGGAQGISVESVIDTQSVGALQDALLRTHPRFRISKLLGYFKLKEGKKTLREADNYVEIEIKYSLVAWDLAKDKGEQYPKVAYLGRINNTWVDEWIEFDANHKDVDIEVVSNVPGSPYRYLKIRHKHLPDPLIGGC